jgi:ATP-dependent DNA ligase
VTKFAEINRENSDGQAPTFSAFEAHAQASALDCVRRKPSPLRYINHVRRYGAGLFAAACAQDLEGIVAKLAIGRYDRRSG